MATKEIIATITKNGKYKSSDNDIISKDFYIKPFGDKDSRYVVAKLMALPDHKSNKAIFVLSCFTNWNNKNKIEIKFGISFKSYQDAEKIAKTYTAEYTTISSGKNFEGLPNWTLLMDEVRCNDYGSPIGPVGFTDALCVYVKFSGKDIPTGLEKPSWLNLDKGDYYQTSAKFSYLCDRATPQFHTNKGGQCLYDLISEGGKINSYYGLKVFARYPHYKYKRPKPFPDDHYKVYVELIDEDVENSELKEEINKINSYLSGKKFYTTNMVDLKNVNITNITNSNNGLGDTKSILRRGDNSEADARGLIFWHKFSRYLTKAYSSKVKIKLTNVATETSTTYGQSLTTEDEEKYITVDLEAPTLTAKVINDVDDAPGNVRGSNKHRVTLVVYAPVIEDASRSASPNCYLHFCHRQSDITNLGNYAAIFHRLNGNKNWYTYGNNISYDKYPSSKETFVDRKYKQWQWSNKSKKWYKIPVVFTDKDFVEDGLTIHLQARRDYNYSLAETSVNLSNYGVFKPKLLYSWSNIHMDGTKIKGDLTVTNKSVGSCKVEVKVGSISYSPKTLSESQWDKFEGLTLSDSEKSEFSITATPLRTSDNSPNVFGYTYTIEDSIDVKQPTAKLTITTSDKSGNSKISYKSYPEEALIRFGDKDYASGDSIKLNSNENKNYTFYLRRIIKSNNKDIGYVHTAYTHKIDTRYPTVSMSKPEISGNRCSFTIDITPNTYKCITTVELIEQNTKASKKLTPVSKASVKSNIKIEDYEFDISTIYYVKVTLHNVANSINIVKTFDTDDKKIYFDRCAYICTGFDKTDKPIWNYAIMYMCTGFDKTGKPIWDVVEPFMHTGKVVEKVVDGENKVLPVWDEVRFTKPGK